MFASTLEYVWAGDLAGTAALEDKSFTGVYFDPELR